MDSSQNDPSQQFATHEMANDIHDLVSQKVTTNHGSVPELDVADDELVLPTEEEKDSLRRIPGSIPWNVYLIWFAELAERFAFFGSSVVFTNFIQQPLPPGSHTGAGFADGQSGALGLGQRASTGLTTFFVLWCYVTPLLGGYIADGYLGRFNTMCIAMVIRFLGHILLVVATIPGVIEHQSALGVLIVAMIIIGVGTGLISSNVSPLLGEQCTKTTLYVRTMRNGERVLVDPALTISRVYMYFYLIINIAALFGQISMTYCEKFVGFWLAYTLALVVFLICPLILFLGRNRFVRSPPTGSVLVTALRLCRYAMRGKWSLDPVKSYRRLKAPGFWEEAKASSIQARGEEVPAWMTFEDQWVDEVKIGLKACAVLGWFPIYCNTGLTYNQLNNNLTSQAATMSTHNVPNDVLTNLAPFALIIMIPICDFLIYPALRRAGLKFSPLRKFFAGFIMGALAMVWAAVLQHYVYKTNPCGYKATTCRDSNGNTLVSPLSVWIQTGSYVLIALSEIFASITGLEYAFTKAPKNMRSFITAIFLLASAVSAALGEAFVSLSDDPLLVWNYGVMGVLAAVTGVAFWFFVRREDVKENETTRKLVDGQIGKEK